MNDTITTNYRVVATTKTQFGTKLVSPPSVMWEGTNTDELSRKYPPSEIFGADPLFQKEIEGGFIITRFTFEQQLADGSWEEIDDPRRRLTPVTALERAIDEENRRLFPGDYITEEPSCYRCDDHGCDECDDQGYSVNCADCDDYGCASCDPNWCTECDNHGCADCDPGNICPSCDRYIDPRHESLDKDSGLCQGCEYERKPKCCSCSQPHDDASKADNDVCSDCDTYWCEQDRQYDVWWRRMLRACMRLRWFNQ